MTDAVAPEPRFGRVGTRHRLTAREVFVTEVSRPVDAFIRVTLSGPELHDFVSTGPADHAKVFFPHPITGELVAPTPLGPDADGIVRPEAPMFARDFTPLNVRTDPTTGHRAFDIDVLRHSDPGPAAEWAERATVGDRLVIAGPRGSISAPQSADRVLCIVDPTAFPATSRFIAEVPESTRVEVYADVSPADLEWVDDYLAVQGGRRVEVYEIFGGLDSALRDAGVDDDTFLFAAGEAARLIPLRRMVKHELGLSRDQYALSGYWKRGMSNFDHHAPIDPNDPED